MKIAALAPSKYAKLRDFRVFWTNLTKIRQAPYFEELMSVLERRICLLEKNLENEKALTGLVVKVRAIFPHSFKDGFCGTSPQGKQARYKPFPYLLISIRSKGGVVSELKDPLDVFESGLFEHFPEFHLGVLLRGMI